MNDHRPNDVLVVNRPSAVGKSEMDPALERLVSSLRNYRERAKCPWCGHLTHADQIQRPTDFCKHDYL